MNYTSYKTIVAVVKTAICLAIVEWAMPGSAQENGNSKFKIEVKEVSVLPHLHARYKTMKVIPEGDYQDWHMDAGSVVAQEVVEVPNHQDTK